MKKLIRKMIIIMIFTIAIMPLKSNAGFEANKGGTSYMANANDFFNGIREMEKEGGTLGLNAELEETSYLDTTKNGLDCHMVKNTEWGTVAMLAASIYGKAPEGTSDLSTTENESGVFQMADNKRENVAGIYDTTSSYINKLRSANSRYCDLYTNLISKPGDATTETSLWKEATYADFITTKYIIFGRSADSLFGFIASTAAYGTVR